MKNNRETEMSAVQKPIDGADPEHTQQSSNPGAPAKSSTSSRRKFLGQVGLGAAATIAAGTGATASAQSPFQSNKCDDFNFPLGVEPGNLSSNRFTKAYKCRLDAAKLARSRKLV